MCLMIKSINNQEPLTPLFLISQVSSAEIKADPYQVLSPAKSAVGDDDREEFAEWELEFLQSALNSSESPEVAPNDSMSASDEPMADVDPYLCNSPDMRKAMGSPLGSLTANAVAEARYS